MNWAARIAPLLLLIAGVPSVFASDDPYRPGGGDERLDAAAAAVQLGVPRRVELSRHEAVIEIPVVVRPVGIGGTIQRVEFADLQVNGIPFEVETYETSFELPEKEAVELSAPLRLHVNFAKVAPSVVEQALYPNDELRLTGKATVTGTFRKWIFSVTRAIEIPVDVSRPNPIAAYHPGRYLVEKLGEFIPK